jgi:hypothetical protein
MITTLRIPAFCAVAASVSSVPAVRGAEEGLSKEAAAAKVEAVWKERRAVLEKERAAELEAKAITIGDKTLKFEARASTVAQPHPWQTMKAPRPPPSARCCACRCRAAPRV